jgi:hypothetical protein
MCTVKLKHGIICNGKLLCPMNWMSYYKEWLKHATRAMLSDQRIMERNHPRKGEKKIESVCVIK